MRIAIFSVAYYPFVGGAEIALKEITNRLPGNDFICFTHRFDSDWPKEEKVGQVGVLRLGRGGANYYRQPWQKFLYIFRAWRAAERAHRQKPFDVIWAMMASYGGLAALLFKLRHRQVSLLLTLQEGDSERHILSRVNIFYPLWRLIFTKADHIQTISNYLADFARRHGAKCPIEVVPNGVATRKFEILNSKSDTKTIITTSRLVHKNGIDTLIRAAAALKPLIPNSKFLIQIVGGGPDETKLKKLAKDLNVADRIEFLGQVDPAKIPELLAGADIFTRPSRSEGLGNSFLEAMAAGLPVIGTPVGGIPDFLKDPSISSGQATGLFCKVNDPEDLAQKIKLLMTDDDLRQRISQTGQALVFKNYSWNNIARKIGGLLSILTPK